jgi:hypothetical protein
MRRMQSQNWYQVQLQFRVRLRLIAIRCDRDPIKDLNIPGLGPQPSEMAISAFIPLHTSFFDAFHAFLFIRPLSSTDIKWIPRLFRRWSSSTRYLSFSNIRNWKSMAGSPGSCLQFCEDETARRASNRSDEVQQRLSSTLFLCQILRQELATIVMRHWPTSGSWRLEHHFVGYLRTNSEIFAWTHLRSRSKKPCAKTSQ